MTYVASILRLHQTLARFRTRGGAVLMVAFLLLAACQQGVPEESAVAGAGADEQGTMEQNQVQAVAADKAAAPVRLQIPDIEMDVPVTPMEWHVITVGGTRTTAWDVPLDSLGWHPNSAGAGAKGNVLLSGRQADGDALLEPLALGSIKPGQDVILTDENGAEFTYRIREVSEPIPVSGATEEEEALALEYVAPTDEAELTLISGWPEFTTTHRIFAVADLVDRSE
jgi:sortase (surface protein transpeptidase)